MLPDLLASTMQTITHFINSLRPRSDDVMALSTQLTFGFPPKGTRILVNFLHANSCPVNDPHCEVYDKTIVLAWQGMIYNNLENKSDFWQSTPEVCR